MNGFVDFANDIKQDVNQIESNINRTIDDITRELNLNQEEQYLAILADLRNNISVQGINPEDIKDMTDVQALKFIRTISITNYYNELSESTPPPEITPSPRSSLNQENTEDILQDTQISGIFNEIRSEFPEITPSPSPSPSPSTNIEEFEDIPLSLSIAVRVNHHLKQKFIDNFKF